MASQHSVRKDVWDFYWRWKLLQEQLSLHWGQQKMLDILPKALRDLCASRFPLLARR